MSAFNARTANLETLIRLALHNQELAPGVAKQIDLFRTELSSASEKRLIAVLDDAIAAGFIAVIDPILIKPGIRSATPYTAPRSHQLQTQFNRPNYHNYQ